MNVRPRMISVILPFESHIWIIYLVINQNINQLSLNNSLYAFILYILDL